MPRVHVSVAIGLLGVVAAILPSLAAPPLAMPDTTIVLPGGGRPLDLDDMIYFSELGRVVVPGAQAGNLDFIDPATDEISVVSVVKSRLSICTASRWWDAPRWRVKRIIFAMSRRLTKSG